jgi:hypothetical protein
MEDYIIGLHIYEGSSCWLEQHATAWPGICFQCLPCQGCRWVRSHRLGRKLGLALIASYSISSALSPSPQPPVYNEVLGHLPVWWPIDTHKEALAEAGSHKVWESCELALWVGKRTPFSKLPGMAPLGYPRHN